MQRLEPRALVELFLSGVLLAYKERKKKLGLMPETLRQNLTLSSEFLKKKTKNKVTHTCHSNSLYTCTRIIRAHYIFNWKYLDYM